jgi:uncharacterized protein (DUF2141 family)
MKKFILSAAFLLSGLFMVAQTNDTKNISGTTITVNVPVPGYGGSLIAGLFNEDTFMKGAPLQGQSSQIMEGYATVTFTNVLPGTYAITLFHDKNDNKIMDFEPNGMPKEMFGVSNNVMNYGPPQWNDAKFEVGTEPMQMEIRL